MRIVVAGGHGQIARLFGELAAPEHEVTGLIRDPAQAGDLETVGMTPLVIDLEQADSGRLAGAMAGCDAVVFAAGAGPGSGAARKETVDYGGAVKCVDAAVEAGARRFLMVSAMGTDDPPADDSVFSIYLWAKSRADAYLMDSDLEWTVVRPGRLTDQAPTGHIHLARHVPSSEIPRADVAAVLVECLRHDATRGKVFEVVGGDAPIAEAVAAAGA
jgi:uncharacterized protein YbjT (DUF2867 family)